MQTRFGGTLPALGSGDALPALGASALVNLSAQGDVAFPHAPGRAGKANPAYAAVVKLGAQPAGIYQVTVSGGAWVDVGENSDLAKPSGFVQRQGLPRRRQEHPFQEQRRPARHPDQRLLRQDDQDRGGARGMIDLSTALRQG